MWPRDMTNYCRIYKLFLRKNNLSIQEIRNKGAKTISGLTCLWDSGSTNRMIKWRHTRPYEHNIIFNNMEYSTAAGSYCTTHDVKVRFFMPEFSSSNIILHHFQIHNNDGKSVIGYCIIIGHKLMAQIRLLDEFKLPVLQWDGVTVTMKEPRGMIGQTDRTSRDMRDEVIQTAELVSTREATERLLKYLTVPMRRHTLNM